VGQVLALFPLAAMSVTILLAQLDAFPALLDLRVLEERQQLLLAELDNCLM